MNQINNIVDFIESGLMMFSHKENPDKIKLYNHQYKLLQRLETEDKMVILKARQVGITSLFLLHALYKAINNEGYVAYFMFSNNNQISNFRKNLIYILDRMGMSNDFGGNKNKITFKNGSVICMVDQTHGDIGIANFAYVDECASYLSDFKYEKCNFIDKLVVASTAGKSDTNFHKLWKENKNGLGAFYPVKLPYDVHPERDIEWLERQKVCLGKKMIKSELKCKFIKDKK